MTRPGTPIRCRSRGSVRPRDCGRCPFCVRNQRGLVAACVLAFWTLVVVAGNVNGQSSDVDTLTRCVQGEAFDHARDHAAQLHVLQKRARWSGRTLVEQATAYANGCTASRVERDRAKYPEAWEAAQRRVEAFQRGELADPCRGRADGWGGTAKGTERDQRVIAACVADGSCEVVDCGGTLNTFFRSKKP